MTKEEAQRLSRMFWCAQEIIEMFHDVVLSQDGRVDKALVRLRDEIDAFRAEHGWSPNGYGNEQA